MTLKEAQPYIVKSSTDGLIQFAEHAIEHASDSYEQIKILGYIDMEARKRRALQRIESSTNSAEAGIEDIIIRIENFLIDADLHLQDERVGAIQ